jgi:DNA-binding protein HU-beta
VNKAELIEALATRLGDKRAAGDALDAVLAEVQSAVTKGDKVSITGFGVFEKRVRAARMARNPRTGAAVRVKKTSVPAFRPGSGFKEMVASGRVPKGLKAAPVKATKKAATPAKKAAAAPAASTGTTSTTRSTAAKKTAAPRKATKKATKAAKSPAKRAPARKATKR